MKIIAGGKIIFKYCVINWFIDFRNWQLWKLEILQQILLLHCGLPGYSGKM